MRTTINVDDDVWLAVRDRARRERRSAGQVLSELAREGLTHGERGSSGPEGAHHGFRPFPPRGAVISNELIDRLREDEPE